MKYRWDGLLTQDAVIAQTQGVAIARILWGDDLTHGDVGWELVDGRRVEYEVSLCMGDSHGYTEADWYIGTPVNP